MEGLYSKIIKAGDRTYFVDVREARNLSRYVSISCTAPGDRARTFKRTKVVIFAEELFEVALALSEAVPFVAEAESTRERLRFLKEFQGFIQNELQDKDAAEIAGRLVELANHPYVRGLKGGA